jgi:hypothetical protein
MAARATSCPCSEHDTEGGGTEGDAATEPPADRYGVVPGTEGEAATEPPAEWEGVVPGGVEGVVPGGEERRRPGRSVSGRRRRGAAQEAAQTHLGHDLGHARSATRGAAERPRECPGRHGRATPTDGLGVAVSARGKASSRAERGGCQRESPTPLGQCTRLAPRMFPNGGERSRRRAPRSDDRGGRGGDSPNFFLHSLKLSCSCGVFVYSFYHF